MLNGFEFEIVSAIKLFNKFEQPAYPHRVFRYCTGSKKKTKGIMQSMRKRNIIKYNREFSSWEINKES